MHNTYLIVVYNEIIIHNIRHVVSEQTTLIQNDNNNIITYIFLVFGQSTCVRVTYLYLYIFIRLDFLRVQLKNNILKNTILFFLCFLSSFFFSYNDGLPSFTRRSLGHCLNDFRLTRKHNNVVNILKRI